MKVVNTKILLVVFASLVILVFVVWKYKIDGISAPSLNRKALTQLQADMQGVNPHFIDTRNIVDRPLTSVEEKIQNDVIATYVAYDAVGNTDFYSRLWLSAIGKRYILVTQPIAGSTYDAILDSQTGKSTRIPAEANSYPAFDRGRNLALYIDKQHLYTYALDQASYILVPGSTLSGNETYDSGESDFSDVVSKQTHTDRSITITVFNTSNRVPNPPLGAQATKNGEVRQLTLPLL